MYASCAAGSTASASGTCWIRLRHSSDLLAKETLKNPAGGGWRRVESTRPGGRWDGAMQRQGSFSQAEYAGKKKKNRRDKFLAEMERVVPWTRLVDRLRPFYPKGERGRPPIGLERMLRLRERAGRLHRVHHPAVLSRPRRRNST